MNILTRQVIFTFGSTFCAFAWAADPAVPLWQHPDWWVAWSTIALALVTAVLALFTYRLWRDAKESGDRQAKATQDSLAISRIAANAASEQEAI